MSNPNPTIGLPEGQPLNISLKDWWNFQHQRDYNLLLSNSDPADVLSIHKVTVKPGMTVLDIGIGFGAMAKHLKALGANVHCMDIAPEALQKVAGVAEHGWLVTDTLPADTFDLAVCHLVAQHVTDADLVSELRNILHSLKATGMLSMQFANNAVTSGGKQTLAAQEWGGVCRTVETAQELAKKAGGRVIDTIQTGLSFLPNITTWFVLHVGRS